MTWGTLQGRNVMVTQGDFKGRLAIVEKVDSSQARTSADIQYTLKLVSSADRLTVGRGAFRTLKRLEGDQGDPGTRSLRDLL